MAHFVLHLRHQRQFAAEAWGAGNPRAFGQSANDFGMRVLLNHANELAAVFGWHPIAGLNFFTARNAGFKLGQQCRIFGDAVRFFLLIVVDISSSVHGLKFICS